MTAKRQKRTWLGERVLKQKSTKTSNTVNIVIKREEETKKQKKNSNTVYKGKDKSRERAEMFGSLAPPQKILNQNSE